MDGPGGDWRADQLPGAPEPWMDASERVELPAGPGQLIVVYASGDTGMEIDPVELYGRIAADAARLADDEGMRITAMTSTHLRHGGVAFGAQGSGYATKLVVVVTYGAAPS